MIKLMKPALRTMNTRTVQVPGKTADDFYLSPEWRRCIGEIIRERGRICEDVTCNGRTHRTGMRVFGDHIVELRDGGAPFDKSNIMLRCGASHTRKTAAVRAQRMAEKY